MKYQHDTRGYHAKAFRKGWCQAWTDSWGQGTPNSCPGTNWLPVKEEKLFHHAILLCKSKAIIPTHPSIPWTWQQRINQSPDSTSNAACEILALLKPVGFSVADSNSIRIFIYNLLSKMLAVIIWKDFEAFILSYFTNQNCSAHGSGNKWGCGNPTPFFLTCLLLLWAKSQELTWTGSFPFCVNREAPSSLLLRWIVMLALIEGFQT